MCGIAGLLVDGRREEELRAAGREMAGTLAHRGPDDASEFVDAKSGVALGFRRLAILDPSPAGRQPMRSPSGRYVIVYNGEVYNFRALRRELERPGLSFRSDSDTEVILATFDRWGIRDSLPRFRGMFAMAVWDTERREITLARDRLGVKPLFVYSGEGTVAFASELKALCRAPGFPRRLDHDALASYLRYLYVPAPDAIFRDTRKLPPGHTLTVPADSLAGLPDPSPYWSLDRVASAGVEDRFRGTPREAAERLGELLAESVRLRMIADVPVGALFSGGIDSTSVVAAMQEEASGSVKTFTVGFDRDEHDESEPARAVADYLGTDHTELRVGEGDALDLVPRLPEMFDEPLANPSQIPTFLVCELARRRVTVGLAGDGGDEVFGGYNRYAAGSRIIPAVSRLPTPVRRGIGSALGAVSTRGWERIYRGLEPLLPSGARHRLPGAKIRKVGDLMTAGGVGEMYRSLVSACGRPEDLLVRGREDPDSSGELPPAQDIPDLTERMMLADQGSYLPDDLLAKVDRASMATSLEVRVPLLDHRLLEFAWRLPPEMKIRRGVTKWILREHLGTRVPRKLWDRPKVGFTVPLAEWLRGSLSDWAADLLSPRKLEREGIFRPDAVAAIRESFSEGETDRSTVLWAVLMFQAWKERWSVSTG